MMRLTSRPAICARVLGRLALCVVEVRRHGDDGVRHRLAEVVFRGLLQLLKNHRRDLRRGVFLALRNHGHVIARLHHLVRHHLHLFIDLVVATAHEALDGVNGVFRIGDGLALGDLSHQPLAILGESDDRWRRPSTFFVGDDFGLAAFHDGDHRVGGTQVNSDNLSHCSTFLKVYQSVSY